MKVKSLTLQNIGMIADTKIPFNKPLILFYGEIRAGKTTILNSVRWLLGGAWPSDIIKHGAQEASIELELEDGLISRSWYVSKDKVIKARPVVFIRNGKPVDRPASEILRLLNPFTLDQDHLRNMGEAERKRFFAELFAVDTGAIDASIVQMMHEASNLRVKIGAYGDIDLTPVPESNESALRQELSQATAAWRAECKKVDDENVRARANNNEREMAQAAALKCHGEIKRLEELLAIERKDLATMEKIIKEHPAMVYRPLPAAPDTSELQAKLEVAIANKEKAKALEQNKKRAQAKADDEAKLATLEKSLRQARESKIAMLEKVSGDSGIPGLKFDADGNFTYYDTHAGMLSTSQIMELTTALSAKYPEGFGIEMIDRAESLGKTIFEYINRAQKESKTILATIVGEAPAKTPPEVGVFVVEAGKVTPK